MLETGMVRAKNVTHTMAMNVVVFCAGTLGFWLCGYAIQSGDWQLRLPERPRRDARRAGPVPVPSDVHGHGRHHPDGGHGRALAVPAVRAVRPVYECLSLPGIRQLGLGRRLAGPTRRRPAAWATATSISPARRSSTWPAAARPWSGAWLIGPRLGKFRADGRANPLPAHNVPMYMTGTLILTFGWFGFNTGAALRDGDPIVRPRRRQHHPGVRGRRLRVHDLHLDPVQEAGRQLPLQRRPGRTGGDHRRLRLRRPGRGRPDRGRRRRPRHRQLPVRRAQCSRSTTRSAPSAFTASTAPGACWPWACSPTARTATASTAWPETSPACSTATPASSPPKPIGLAASLLWVLPVTLIFLLVVRRFFGLRVIPMVEMQGLDVPELGTLGYLIEDAQSPENRYRRHRPAAGQPAARPGQVVHDPRGRHRPGADAENLVGPLPDRRQAARGRVQGCLPVHDDRARQPVPFPRRRPGDGAREPGTAVPGRGMGKPREGERGGGVASNALLRLARSTGGRGNDPHLPGDPREGSFAN